MIGLASAATLTLLAAACGSDESAGATDSAAVEANTWTLEELAGEPVPAGVEVTLDFDGERISGTGGCNQYGGDATFEDGTVTVATEIMSTQMACEDPAADVEGRYLEALPRAAGFVVEDTTLRVSDADDGSLLVFGAAE